MLKYLIMVTYLFGEAAEVFCCMAPLSSSQMYSIF
jgi:hypothetical protein